jgi:hypothetical protein
MQLGQANTNARPAGGRNGWNSAAALEVSKGRIMVRLDWLSGARCKPDECECFEATVPSLASQLPRHVKPTLRLRKPASIQIPIAGQAHRVRRNRPQP